MAKIKTALEIAMEEMDDIEIDYGKINKDKLTKEGKILAGKGLQVDYNLKKLKKALDSYTKEEDKKLVADSIKETVLMNISLPNDELFETRFNRCNKILALLTDNNENVNKIMKQIITLCKQYSESVQNLLQSLKDKYSDVGKDQGIDLEDNKDFVNMYEQNLDNLKKQYDVAMKKGKDSLRTLLFN